MTATGASGGSRVLYVTYDGLLEPLGESQVVAYVERLATSHQITILSFEKMVDLLDGSRVAAMQRRLSGRGVEWIVRRYHKRPPLLSTLFDALRGLAVAWRWAGQGDGRHMIHARSVVAALIALVLRVTRRTPFLYDMRGFWADQRADAGQWSRRSLLYRAIRRVERCFLKAASVVVVVTHQAKRHLDSTGDVPPHVPIAVIHPCVDVDRFLPGEKDPVWLSRHGLAGRPVIGCVGTIGPVYAKRAMLDYLAFLQSRIDSLVVFFVTREDHGRLREEAVAAGVDPARLVMARMTFAEMPAQVRLMDLGMFFLEPTFSAQGAVPTRLGEFLASGVPVVVSDSRGDSGRIVRERQLGVALNAADSPDTPLDRPLFERKFPAVHALIGNADVSARCRQAACDLLDLDEAIKTLNRLYHTILNPDDVRHLR